MRHLLLTRAAYGPAWSSEANARRLAMSAGVTIRSIAAQRERRFDWIVLLHRRDELLERRRAAFAAAGARFLYLDLDGSPADVAYHAYGASWRDAVGPRDEAVAMTRLDDDDALAPWAMGAIRHAAERATRRTIVMLPVGIRVWRGRYTLVQHRSNAMQTLVTPPGDTATVYDYGHRRARQFATVKMTDPNVAWLWSRHDDTISGWRVADRPLTDDIRAMFPVDWSLFGEAPTSVRRASPMQGRVFR